MSESAEQKYFRPGTVITFALLVTIFALWWLPFSSMYDKSISGYDLMFKSDVSLKIFEYIFVSHIVAVFLTLCGDYKVAKCVALPFILFCGIETVHCSATMLNKPTFTPILVGLIYVGAFAMSLYDVVTEKKN